MSRYKQGIHPKSPAGTHTRLTCRDDYIGWNQKAFIERIVTVDNDRAKEEFKQLLVYLEDGIDGIDYSELCTAMVVKNPTDTDIQLLLDEASNAEQGFQTLLWRLSCCSS